MEEKLKTRIIIILGIITLIFAVIAVTSCNNAMQLDKKRKTEILKRMTVEEIVSNAGRDKDVAQKKLDVLTKELAAEKTAHEATKRLLLQEQLVSQSLQEDVGKLTKLREKLEDDLKDALAAAARSAQTLPKK